MNLSARLSEYWDLHPNLLIVLIFILVLLAASAIAAVFFLIKKRCEEKPFRSARPQPGTSAIQDTEQKEIARRETTYQKQEENIMNKKDKTGKPTAETAKTASAKTASTSKTANSSAAAEKKSAKIPSAIAPMTNQYGGRWLIAKDSDKSYSFTLRASNGETLLRSGSYASLTGAKGGIDTFKSNIKKGNFKVVQTKSGDYIFQLLNARGTLLAYGEDYKTRASCESAIESTKRFASSASIEIAADDETK